MSKGVAGRKTVSRQTTYTAMKTKLRILRAPAEAAAPATVPARESTPPDLSLGTEGIADALQHLELPEGVGDAFKEAPLSEADKAAAKKLADDKVAAAAKSAAAAKAVAPSEEPKWNADQLAWFELRQKATTAEEIAAADAQAPEFSAEESAWLEKANEAAGATDATTKPELTPEAEAWVKENLETPLATAKAEAEAASRRAEAAEAKLAELANAAPPVAANLHPLALADKPEQIDGYEKSLEDFITWGKANWDGSEEVAATADQPGQRAYTAAEIRKAVAQREQELRKVIPAARENLKVRQNMQQFAQGLYPDLFDAQKPEGQALTGLIRQYPFLKSIPNIHTIAGDAFVGDKLRGILADPKHKSFAAANQLLAALPEVKNFLKLTVTAPAKAARPLPPKLTPPRASAAGPSRVAPRKPADKGPDVKKFIEQKNTAATEMEALAAVLGD